MCLGVPARVIETYSQHGLRMAKVDLGGIRQRVCLEHTPEAQIGSYVVVHVGFALSVIDEAEAAQVFKFLERIEELDEIKQLVEQQPAESGREIPG